jgi:ribosomal protein S18 acetylase RimI-like enzyme
MAEIAAEPRIRPLDELDIGDIARIDERISGIHRPEYWEQRVTYYLRRDPEASQVCEQGGRVVGFVLGQTRSGEFGLEETSGWVERFGIDPQCRGRDLGRRMVDAMVTHFRARGATAVRTLVDRGDAGVAAFLGKVGFAASPLQTLEIRLTPTVEGSAR